MLINRDKYLNLLKLYTDDERVKVITGPRRSGKSYLLKEIFIPFLKKEGIKKTNIIYLDLDDDKNAKYYDPIYLSDYINSKLLTNDKHFIIIDEIQKVYSIINLSLTNGKHVLTKKHDTEIISFVNVVLGLSKRKNVSVFITGSNSKMLSKDIETSFRGKCIEINLLPPSFHEFLSVQKGDINESFNEFKFHGSMPEMLKEKTDEAKEKYLLELIKLTYSQDIVDRLNLDNDKALLETIKILADCTGQLINAKKITDTYKSITKNTISENTIKSYINALTASFIIEEAYRFDINGKNHIGATRKYYFKDVGLRNAILNFNRDSDSGCLENIVYNELIFRGYSVSVGQLPIYEANKNGNNVKKILEVDFVAIKGSKKYYIQVSKSLNNDKVMDREIRSLKLINDSFKKIIITDDLIKTKRDENGILIMNTKDFILNVNSLDI